MQGVKVQLDLGFYKTIPYLQFGFQRTVILYDYIYCMTWITKSCRYLYFLLRSYQIYLVVADKTNLKRYAFLNILAFAKMHFITAFYFVHNLWRQFCIVLFVWMQYIANTLYQISVRCTWIIWQPFWEHTLAFMVSCLNYMWWY